MPDQPISILVVEDEAVIAMDLKQRLLAAGFRVAKVVATGEAALVHVALVPPDLVLMDVGLAGRLDGFETARQLQAQADIPIIFVSGYADETFQDKAKALKSSGSLEKPVEMDELTAAIDAALRLRG